MLVPLISFRLSVCDVVSKTKTLLNTDELRFESYFKIFLYKSGFYECRLAGSRTLP